MPIDNSIYRNDSDVNILYCLGCFQHCLNFSLFCLSRTTAGNEDVYLVTSDSTIRVDFPRGDTIKIPYQSSEKEYVINEKVESRLADLLMEWMENNPPSEESK